MAAPAIVGNRDYRRVALSNLVKGGARGSPLTKCTLSDLGALRTFFETKLGIEHEPDIPVAGDKTEHENLVDSLLCLSMDVLAHSNLKWADESTLSTYSNGDLKLIHMRLCQKLDKDIAMPVPVAGARNGKTLLVAAIFELRSKLLCAAEEDAAESAIGPAPDAAKSLPPAQDSYISTRLKAPNLNINQQKTWDAVLCISKDGMDALTNLELYARTGKKDVELLALANLAKAVQEKKPHGKGYETTKARTEKRKFMQDEQSEAQAALDDECEHQGICNGEFAADARRGIPRAEYERENAAKEAKDANDRKRAEKAQAEWELTLRINRCNFLQSVNGCINSEKKNKWSSMFALSPSKTRWSPMAEVPLQKSSLHGEQLRHVFR